MDEKMNITIVYIDDDEKMKNDAFLDDIETEVDGIEYFERPSEGLTYIKDFYWRYQTFCGVCCEVGTIRTKTRQICQTRPSGF